MTNDEPIEDILDTIGDPLARTVLAALSTEPRSASDLAEKLGYAPSTIYNRLNELVEHDLITSDLRLSRDGNHYRVYQCNFESTVISLSDDEYDVRIYRKDNLPDRFERLWDDLGSR